MSHGYFYICDRCRARERMWQYQIEDNRPKNKPSGWLTLLMEEITSASSNGQTPALQPSQAELNFCSAGCLTEYVNG